MYSVSTSLRLAFLLSISVSHSQVMTSQRPPVADAKRNVSVESYPYVVDDRYYVRRMKEILQDGQPRPSLPAEQDRVSKHVYIGNQRNADDVTGLRSAGIDHVLSCAASRRSTASPYEADSGVVDYFLIPAEDREDFDITRYFDAAFLFLDRVRRRRGKALVHCNMGVNRSGAVVAAYLMVDEQKNLLEVISYLKDKRRIVLSNKGFRMQLIQFARGRGLLDPVVDTVTRISYMDERRRRAKSEEDGDHQRRNAKKLSSKTEDKVPFKQLMLDLEHELKNGNEASLFRPNKESETGNVDEKWTGNDLVWNGTFDSTFLRPTKNNNNNNISSISKKPLKSDLNDFPRKYSSSVQYWPVVETPRKTNACLSPLVVNGQQDSGATSDQTPAVTKKRRYVRTRSDCRPEVETERDKPTTVDTEPHKLLSTIFCTLRAKPKRITEVVKQEGVVDGFQRIQIGDRDFSTYNPRESTSKSPLESSPFIRDETPVNYRLRCRSGTPSDRPSSFISTTNTTGSSGNTAERSSNGFLVLLGKKVIHSKSSSQWNLSSSLDKESGPFFSTESRRTGISTECRRNLNELSGTGSPWKSVERISESKNFCLIRKEFF